MAAPIAPEKSPKLDLVIVRSLFTHILSWNSSNRGFQKKSPAFANPPPITAISKSKISLIIDKALPTYLPEEEINEMALLSPFFARLYS